MGTKTPGTKSFPTSSRYNKEKEAADAARMFALRTGEEDGTKYTPKLLEKDASHHRDIEIGKLDLLEERLWTMIDEDYYTVSQGHVVYMDTGDPVPDIDPVMKIIDRLLKVMERRSKLLGLDKPVRVEATIHTMDNVDMELAEMIRRGRADQDGSNHSRG